MKMLGALKRAISSSRTIFSESPRRGSRTSRSRVRLGGDGLGERLARARPFGSLEVVGHQDRQHDRLLEHARSSSPRSSHRTLGFDEDVALDGLDSSGRRRRVAEAGRPPGTGSFPRRRARRRRRRRRAARPCATARARPPPPPPRDARRRRRRRHGDPRRPRRRRPSPVARRGGAAGRGARRPERRAPDVRIIGGRTCRGGRPSRPSAASAAAATAEAGRLHHCRGVAGEAAENRARRHRVRRRRRLHWHHLGGP